MALLTLIAVQLVQVKSVVTLTRPRVRTMGVILTLYAVADIRALTSPTDYLALLT
jgi:hypothetical protein